MSAVTQAFAQSEALRRFARQDENSAPYPWVMLPPGGISFFAHNSIPAPDYGLANQLEICSYIVPDGWEGVLLDVMNTSTDNAGTFVEGSGDIIWTIDIDWPVGNPLGTSRYLPDYANIKTSLGDLVFPWPVRGGWRMKQGEVYRYKVRTVQNVNQGEPHFLHGSLLGWVWPMARQGV